MPPFSTLLTSYAHPSENADDALVRAEIGALIRALDAIDLGDLAHANVAQVVATLKHLGRRHVLVIEKARDLAGAPRVRGVISQAQVERQLGSQIPVVEVAHNFAEITASLSAA